MMSEPSSSSSKAKIFLRRLISSVVLWTVVLAGLFSGNTFLSNSLFLIIIVLLALTGLAEFYGIVEKLGLVCFKSWGIAGGILLMVGTFLNLTGKIGTSGSPSRVNDFETSFLILFVLGLCLRQFFSTRNPNGIVAISTTSLAITVLGWPALGARLCTAPDSAGRPADGARAMPPAAAA